ncbi:Hypothetical predicted protein [Lecanosticta acicola]|uniref:Uncharacterized protein n=1 Tax=Lecanosticta acicola TaxID=111012 RepID=A0AAI9EA58_9PEZI|nr:Hypothetical predicted protein [Lecanosticta acicola]
MLVFRKPSPAAQIASASMPGPVDDDSGDEHEPSPGLSRQTKKPKGDKRARNEDSPSEAPKKNGKTSNKKKPSKKSTKASEREISLDEDDPKVDEAHRKFAAHASPYLQSNDPTLRNIQRIAKHLTSVELLRKVKPWITGKSEVTQEQKLLHFDIAGKSLRQKGREREGAGMLFKFSRWGPNAEDKGAHKSP